ncbi:Na+/H+ antiporter [Mycolicibacterium brumae]|uniref:Na+/H+ antiporter n=1 Tax=Mycolicibacterium brumae TaxID=85968 RepID=A0A2G5PCW1_9MYCO|nr:Na+/H+ antiporter [Mycolicibacterium brumae]MCV7191456.1 Na+/H+ antiporter [Mycolicibacterium brumae]PIB75734.1 Na+/H+ antiporter [Mycolicibacterium brumae]RWA16168.1 hypothetical protein MBRU_08650 [Mycolicibacterium brumae DSM 44177]UWW09436.1 Na+/H+ antiporter [Mycolicibacterium brumae]
MELILVVGAAIVIAAMAHRRGLEPALVIVVVGIAASFAPDFEPPELDSHILLTLVLPPLLYSAALNFSFPTFRRNIRPILGLGVGLVVITAFTVAVLSDRLDAVPMTFAVALVLGAIVAPPDAVTAVAVGRKLGLPRRVMAILTGESLINDAAALTLFSVAVAHVAGEHIFIENPALLFGYSAAVGPLVGVALGYLTLWIRKHLDNPGLETAQGLLAPFAAYILAEQAQASGVLAVVAAGFVVGNGTVGAHYKTRLQERYVWDSLDVLLEAFVFAYIGLNLRFVLQELNEAHDSVLHVAVASLLVLVIVLVVRPASVFLMFGRRKLTDQARDRVPLPTVENGESGRRLRWRAIRRRTDLQTLSWQESVVVSWTGMRGVVTLAAAAAIPVTTASGEPFPERAAIQAIAFTVTVGTLLLQGSTLPALIRRLGVREDAEAEAAELRAAAAVAQTAAAGVLDEFRANPPVGLDPQSVDSISATITRQSGDAENAPDPDQHTPRTLVYIRLYRKVLRAQRAALIAERDAGNIEDEVTRTMLDRLDLQEAGVSARLQSRL